MIKLVFFVPEEFKEKVKNELFKIGAGKIGNYDCCAFETKGRGQFRANNQAKPFIGEVGELEYVSEFRVELVLNEDLMPMVEKKLLEIHPYETPAYEFYRLLNK